MTFGGRRRAIDKGQQTPFTGTGKNATLSILAGWCAEGYFVTKGVATDQPLDQNTRDFYISNLILYLPLSNNHFSLQGVLYKIFLSQL